MARQIRSHEPREREQLREIVCLVTGSSRGIGRGIVEELGRRGTDVVVNYCSSEACAHEVVAQIEDAGGSAMAVQANVTDREQVATMRDRVHDAIGSTDVLVNNPGITADGRFQGMTWGDWTRVLAVCLDGTFTCPQAFFEDIRDADDGWLINISSIIGKHGNYGQANYAAAKSDLFDFTRSLALELAPYDSRGNCIAPGFTHTDMVADVRDDIQDTLREQIPLSGFADVQDIARLVRYLASPESSYMTGEVIDLNGGLHL